MKNNKSGISVWEVLTIVFVILKLCNIIKWSWIWVLSPFWISVLFFFIIMGIIYGGHKK